MSNQIKLKIITPNGIFWDKKINIVTLKTTEGYIGLQKNKSPFIASLDIAELNINSKNNSDYKVCAIAGGIVIANRNYINIITDAIEYKEKIDLVRAKKAQKRAEALINSKISEVENFKAQLALKKAINRINVRKQN